MCPLAADLPTALGTWRSVSLAIRENTRSCVSIEVSLRSPGNKTGHIAYELNVGAAFIKTTAGAGVEKLRVGAPCRFAILPDFFGDDIVVDAAALSVSARSCRARTSCSACCPAGTRS